MYLFLFVLRLALFNPGIDPGTAELLRKIANTYAHHTKMHIRMKVYSFDKSGKKEEGHIVEYATTPGMYYSSSGYVTNLENAQYMVHVNTYTRSIVVKNSSSKKRPEKTPVLFDHVQYDSLLNAGLSKATLTKMSNGNTLVRLSYKKGPIREMEIEVTPTGLMRNITSFTTGIDNRLHKDRIEYELTEWNNIPGEIFSHQKFFTVKNNKVILQNEFKDYTLYDNR